MPKTKPTVFPAGWLEKTEAAGHIRRSVKQLEKLAREGTVESKKVPAAEGRTRDWTIYKIADLDRYNEAAASVRPAAAGARAEQQVAKQQQGATMLADALTQAFTKLLEGQKALLEAAKQQTPAPPERQLEAPKEASVPITALKDKVFLSLREAHEFSGVPIVSLRQMRVETPACGRQFGRRFLYRRADLEQL